jgi:peptidoglycan/LPS O-acetylase OafA/YrhL
MRLRDAKGRKAVDGKKLGYLESIRGLAACAVVFAHIIAAYLPGVAQQHAGDLVTNPIAGRLFYGLPLGFMASGHFAVVLFFVLSGFVLTYKFFSSNNQQDLHRQAAKRFFRLAIPIFAIVMVAYVMVANGAMGYTDRVVELTNSPEAARNYHFTPTLNDALHAASVGVFTERDIKLNPVLWTMPIEFFGSFIVLGLAAFIGKVRHRWIVYTGAIVLLGDSYYVCFILGMMLADVVQRTKFVNFVHEKVSRVYFAVALAIVLVIASFPLPSNGLEGTIFESLLIANVDTLYAFKIWQYFGAILLLTVIVTSPLLQGVLNNKILVILGGLSFAIYLTHYLILYSAGHYAYVLSRGTYGVSLSAIIAGSVTVVITLGVAVLWKKYIDDMSVRVSRAFASYILK